MLTTLPNKQRSTCTYLSLRGAGGRKPVLHARKPESKKRRTLQHRNARCKQIIFNAISNCHGRKDIDTMSAELIASTLRTILTKTKGGRNLGPAFDRMLISAGSYEVFKREGEEGLKRHLKDPANVIFATCKSHVSVTKYQTCLGRLMDGYAPGPPHKADPNV